ncbi:recombinase family protein [Clostridioides difficile]|nr:recombinase family protein [Clostridioides difficile]NJK15576.1 recombinase family protein [Clostridioides difficile]
MKCAIYIRVSTDKEEQKTSLQNQKDLFFKYISDKGWDIGKMYIDIESGTKDKREQFQQMISDAKNRSFDIILAKELSRIARNGKLSYEIKTLAENNNIHIITLDNAINTIEGNTHMFGMYAWMYEQESQRISDRVKYALKSRAEKGIFKGSVAPYGYYCKDGTLFIKNDFTPDIVRRIFNEYISGVGFDAIARNLYNDDIPSPRQIAGIKNASPKWHGSSVRCILENPHFAGNLVQGRTTTKNVTSTKRNIIPVEELIIVENTHEAIISKDDFNAVQQLIASRKRKRPSPSPHLFSNILICKDCGHGMHFKKNRKGYICGNFNKHGIKACTCHIIRENSLKDIVISDINFILDTIQNKSLLGSISSSLNKKCKSNEKNSENIEAKISKLMLRKNNALSKFVDDYISKEDYDNIIKVINSEIIELKNKKLLLENQVGSKLSSDISNGISYFKNIASNVTELTPSSINRLIDKIEVSEDGTPRIYYRFSESSICLSDFINIIS